MFFFSFIFRAETTCSTPTRVGGISDSLSIAGDDPDSIMNIPDMEVVSTDMSNELIAKAVMKSGANPNDDREEELCQLVINILFTVMWRGLQVRERERETKKCPIRSY